MKHVLQGINYANFLQKFWKEKKVSQNSYSENSIPKSARLCDRKSLM